MKITSICYPDEQARLKMHYLLFSHKIRTYKKVMGFAFLRTRLKISSPLSVLLCLLIWKGYLQYIIPILQSISSNSLFNPMSYSLLSHDWEDEIVEGLAYPVQGEKYGPI